MAILLQSIQSSPTCLLLQSIQSSPTCLLLDDAKKQLKNSSSRDWKIQNVVSFDNCSISSKLASTLKVFDEIPQSDTFVWKNIVQTHFTNGDYEFAMWIYTQMLRRGVSPDKHTLSRLLTASHLSDNLFYGKQIHGQVFKLGLFRERYVVTALMALYGHYDGVQGAKRVFEQCSTKWNSVSWTMLLKLFATQDKPSLVIQVFKDMVDKKVRVDVVALVTVLEACGALKSLREGKKVHEIAKKLRLDLDVLVANSLLKMYMDCGSIKGTRMVFRQMRSKDVNSWTALVNWYANNGEHKQALKLFRLINSEDTKPDSVSVSGILPDWKIQNVNSPNSSISSKLANTLKVFVENPPSDTFTWNNMLLQGVRPDKYTLPRLLTASRLSDNFFYGKQIHGQAFKLGFFRERYLVTALMALYGHYDGAEVAKRVFEQCSTKQNSVSWTMLMKLFTNQDKPTLAIEVFKEMVDKEVCVDAVALATVLGACGALKSLREGKRVHDIAKKLGLDLDILVANSLLKMYMDCGSITGARMVFDQMRSKDVISWTALVNWYAKIGEFNEALKLFRLMNSEGTKPDSVSVSGILPGCARISSGKNGKEIHAYTIRNGLDVNLAVQNALVDMYMKSGFLESASKLFVRMKERDTISLTVMVLGYSLHGQGEVGVEWFHKLKKYMHTEIDDKMYDAVLRACNTARMVNEGKSIFKCIKEPKVEHCALMVSLLARAGLFGEAKTFIEERQFEWNAEVLQALLDGCRIYQEKKIAKRIVERLTELEPLNPDNYVLLSNFYAESAQWGIVQSFREMIRDMGLVPKRAYSWIEVRNKVHVFEAGDVSHPRSEMLYHELEILMKKIKEEEGYIPDTDFSLHDVDAERECIPIGHSEMLAISFGLISTQPHTTIRVTKNLRVCRSCHSLAKIISKTVEREIILKVPGCFHHFKDGLCSCGDFY
ncbi:hypothetical protein AQUCO_01400324v1 [Aquilegia coerulea]|uniref:DYW domain-containing protein n=1 Tax=Aquilegia coerulea TaxID=218851 RepID=A0A2G5DVS7_AQUCA|nr:hypothetical protein AQUCO_01400324v1 [Aquilegia coerulea]